MNAGFFIFAYLIIGLYNKGYSCLWCKIQDYLKKKNELIKIPWFKEFHRISVILSSVGAATPSTHRTTVS